MTKVIFDPNEVYEAMANTVDGRNPLRTAWKPWETMVGWYLQGNHHSMGS